MGWLWEERGGFVQVRNSFVGFIEPWPCFSLAFYFSVQLVLRDVCHVLKQVLLLDSVGQLKGNVVWGHETGFIGHLILGLLFGNWRNRPRHERFLKHHVLESFSLNMGQIKVFLLATASLMRGWLLWVPRERFMIEGGPWLRRILGRCHSSISHPHLISL